MKRFLSSSILAILLILTSVPAFAQKTEQTTILPNGQQHTQFATQYGTATMTIPVQTGMTSHQVTYSAPNYSGITVTVKASANNAAFSTISAPTTTGSATVTFTGTYTQIQVIYSGLTGGGPLDADYWGGTGIVVGSSGGTGTDVNIAYVGGNAVTTAVPITDGAGALNVICDSGCSGGTQYTQDAALTVATTVGTIAMGRASAAVPTDVSADNDAVIPWYLRSGALATQLTNGGVLTVSGSGNATGALRVELPTNGTGVIATVGTITNPVATTHASGSVASGAYASGSIASGAVASGAFASGSLSTALPDPCFTSNKTPFVVSVVTATTTQLVAASASNKLYICSAFLYSSAADNVALVEDATGSCASPDAGLLGGTTSGTGILLTANQGFTYGNGGGTVIKTASTNVNVCLITSTTAQVSGNITYVLAP